MNNDERPVLIVTDKDGYLVEAGDPNNFSEIIIMEYIRLGNNLNQIPVKKYRETNYTWIYDKPKTEGNVQ